VHIEIDAEHGGRWSSLRGRSGREWLWSPGDTPERFAVRPGDPFVDAGGMEECLPTIGGVPDHGDAWARPWVPDGDGLSVDGDGYRLFRRMTIDDAGLTCAYRLTAEPGWLFVWAAHTLIDVSTSARLDAPSGRFMWVNDPDGTTSTEWPTFRGTDISLLAEADGLALMIIVPELPEMIVVDGTDRLMMRISVTEQPSGIAVWRNLHGWPPEAPCRQVAIEPMLGYSPTLSLANDGEAAVVPASGVVEWTLTVEAS
jgi:hypothetical protein